MRFHPVTTADALVEGLGFATEIRGRAIALFRSGDHVYAIDNLCPHAGSRLDGGRFKDGAIICPLHGARFNLADGSCRNPQIGGKRPIITHTVRIVENRIEVALSSDPMTAPA